MPDMYAVYDLFTGKGEQVLHTVKKKRVGLGQGWIAMYKRAIRRLINECEQLSTLKIYLFLASKQSYQKLIYITPKAIQDELGMAKKTVFTALRWLEKQGYIQRHIIDGNRAILMCPAQTICGTGTKPSKEKLWSYTEKLRAVEAMPAQLDEDIRKRRELLDAYEKLIKGVIRLDDDVEQPTEEELANDNSHDTLPESDTRGQSTHHERNSSRHTIARRTIDLSLEPTP